MRADPFRDGALIGLGVPAVRLEVLWHLRQGQRTVGQLMNLTAMTRNGVQAHLEVLVASGSVVAEVAPIPGSDRPGRWYAIDDDGLEDLAWRSFEEIRPLHR